MLFAHRSGQKYLAMLEAYFDESGHPADSAVVSVAAVVSTENGWHAFEQKWNRILRRYRVPGLHLHMTDFESRRGTFAQWPIEEEKRVQCIGELAAILKNHIRYGCVVSMDLEEWREPLREAFGHLPDYDPNRTPLIVLLQTCLEEIDRSSRLPRTQDIACMFEKTDFLARAPHHFEQWINTWGLHEKFKSFGFAGKYEFPGFQGADLLAYEGRKHLVNQRRSAQTRPERKLHATLKLSKKIDFRVLDSHAFEAARPSFLDLP